MNNIKCMNCLEFLKEIPDKSIQLVITSPPYDIGKVYENKKQMPIDAYIDNQREIIKECCRVLKENGSIVWQTGSRIIKEKGNTEIIPIDAILYPVFKEQGLKLRNRIAWCFEFGLNATKRFSGRHETCSWYTFDNYLFDITPNRVPQKYPNKKHYKGPKKNMLSGNPAGKNCGDFWIFPNVKNNHCEKIKQHPAQFPVELPERFILSMTEPGDIVLDPYLGVGSSAIAAMKHNRIAYGCDISQEYIDIALERMELFRCGFLKVREMGKPIHEPKK